MRVLFCTTGGLGHLLPLRPLASALRSRGHAVGWVTAPDALPALDELGFEVYSAGPSFEVSRRAFRAAHTNGAQLTGEPLSAYTFPRLFGAVLAPAMLCDVEKAVRHWRPDFVVHEPAALAAPLVCMQLGLRNVTHGYGLWPPSGYLEDAMRFFGTHWQARGLEAPLDGGLFRHLCLDIAPPSLQRPLYPSNEAEFRFNPYRADKESSAVLPADLRAALQTPVKQGPRIYVTFGTVFNRSPALINAARAAAQLGSTVVVTVGPDGDTQSFTGMGMHVSAHRFLDQTALLPHCDLVVSHGGAGTLLGAAAHGVPQLILPQAADHFRNARALCAVNAGRAIEPAHQTTEEVAVAMAMALNSPEQPAAAATLAREMSAMTDAVAAARRLECWHVGTNLT
jgi:UDP:flavonoid glycosyltransferase YjiC (YdhE family)